MKTECTFEMNGSFVDEDLADQVLDEADDMYSDQIVTDEGEFCNSTNRLCLQWHQRQLQQTIFF